MPPDALRARMRAALPTLLDDLATWVDIETNAWGQRYAVMTAARQLYTLATGEVTSKPDALRWAMAALDPVWRPLLEATLRDRSGFDPGTRPDPAVVDETRQLAARGGAAGGPHLGLSVRRNPQVLSPTTDGTTGGSGSRRDARCPWQGTGRGRRGPAAWSASWRDSRSSGVDDRIVGFRLLHRPTYEPRQTGSAPGRDGHRRRAPG